MIVVKKLLEFQWDAGNILKNDKHGVENQETEEVFFDEKKKIFKDHLHSGREERFRIMGVTKKGRLLFVVFTKRKGKVRIISARDINKKEVPLYGKKA